MRFFILAALALVASSPAIGKAVKPVQPLPSDYIGKSMIVETRVTLNDITRANFDKLEAKAAEKRAEAGLPVAAKEFAPGERPKPDDYSTLPIAQMFPLMLEDVAKDWGMTSGKGVRIAVEFDSLKTANAGAAMLFGSSDQLAGLVTVTDAESGKKIGEYYVDVLNQRSGLLGLALRGSGVREKLAAEFSKRLVQTLSGQKKKAKGAS
jgi:hypothetical protein